MGKGGKKSIRYSFLTPGATLRVLGKETPSPDQLASQARHWHAALALLVDEMLAEPIPGTIQQSPISPNIASRAAMQESREGGAG